MKSIMKNKIIYAILLLFMTVALSLSGILFTYTPKAASAATAGNELQFRLGASVRIDTTEAKTSGIRFTAYFSEEFFQTIQSEGYEVGMIIVPKDYVTDYEAQTEYTDYLEYFEKVKGKAKASITRIFSQDKMIAVSDGREIHGALTKVKAANYERSFQAIAYYAVDGVNYYQLSEERSINQVSISAIRQEPITDGVGLYTDEQLGILYGYANGKIPRVLYEGEKLQHASKFQDGETTPTVEGGKFVFQNDGAYQLAKNGFDDVVGENKLTYNKITLKASVSGETATEGVTVGWYDASGSLLGTLQTVSTDGSATLSVTQEQFINAKTLKIVGLNGGSLTFENVVAMGAVDYSLLSYDEIDYTQIDSKEDFQTAVDVLFAEVETNGVTTENAAKVMEAYEANSSKVWSDLGGFFGNTGSALDMGDSLTLWRYNSQAEDLLNQ